MRKSTILALGASILFALTASVGYACGTVQEALEDGSSSQVTANKSNASIKFQKTEKEAMEKVAEAYPAMSCWELFYKYAVEVAEGYCFHGATDAGLRIDRQAIWRYDMESWSVN